eukprot:TRINITY_DN33661_c0_g1_i1.p1 TRINITY_DN33661_c0_g1~~TRINITY_DN33661_c0_g1_i1.p1  ORF type:complete len:527 (-),score=38.20 TRINITY_DN33661_c0_g1_i1:585-2165(-)
MASVKWIIEKIQPRLKTDASVTAKVLCSEVLREYGVDIPYVKMWRARDQALCKIHGGFEESYRMISSLHKTIIKYNLGSIADYKVQNDGSFERFCVFFYASLQGFLSGCRPFIGLDGTFLKGKFKGVLLSVIALDANKQIFPLGIAVVAGETRESWMWFLENLKSGIDDNPFTFVIDRQKGFVDAVDFVFPILYHRFCTRHLYANFQKYYKGELLRDLFWKASLAYTRFEFDSTMDEIDQINPQAKQWIEKVPAEYWSRAFFPDCLPCNQNQNNFTECFNNLIMEARSMHICDMVEWIRKKLMVNMQTRRKTCSRWNGIVCPSIKKMLSDRKEKCRSCDLFFVRDVEYETLERQVMDDDLQHIVNMGNRTCMCRWWQLDGVPCIHAMIAIAHRREQSEDYYHVRYAISTYKTCYESIIHPLPDKRMWEHSGTTPILPPHDRRLPERPRVNRRKGPNETTMSPQLLVRRRQTVKYGLCGQFGHNRKTCKEPINASQSVSTPTVSPRDTVVESSTGRRIKMNVCRGTW